MMRLAVREKAEGLLNSWSYLASDYYAIGKYDEAISIVKYIICKLKARKIENRIGANDYKLWEHKKILDKMKQREWKECFRQRDRLWEMREWIAIILYAEEMRRKRE